MTNGQGLYWGTQVSLQRVSGDGVAPGRAVGEMFDATGDWFTHDEIDTIVNQRACTRVPVNGRNHVVARILQTLTTGATTAANGAEVWVWGVTGFGEYASEDYMNNKVMAVRLAGLNYTKGNKLTESTTVTALTPEGDIYRALDSDHGANSRIFSPDSTTAGSKYAALSEMKAVSSTSPDAAEMSISSTAAGEGGAFQIGGVSPFHELIFTLNNQGHVLIRVNMAIGMH